MPFYFVISLFRVPLRLQIARARLSVEPVELTINTLIILQYGIFLVGEASYRRHVGRRYLVRESD